MHIFKKIISVSFSFLTIALLLASSPVSAEVQTIKVTTSTVTTSQISVKNLKILGNTFNAGATVNGTVTLTNETGTAASDIYYTVLFMGDYQNRIPNVTYGEQATGPLFFNAHEAKEIKFSYVLPKDITGKNLGIRVQAAPKNGSKTGWEDQQIVVVGKNTPLDVTGNVLVIGNKTYASGVGPTVHTGETIAFNVKISNAATSTVNVTPHVMLYDHTYNGAVVKEFDAPVANLTAKKTTDISIALPTDLPAQVYAGRVTFKDAAGNTTTRELNFRYIIGGDIATIQKVTSNKESVAKNDPFIISVDYSGTPEDLTAVVQPGASTTDTSSKGVMSIQVVNENNSVVAEQKADVDLTASHGVQTFNLSAKNAASQIGTKVEISKDGKVLASYTLKLSPPSKASQFAKANPTLVALLSALVGFILGLIIVLRFKRKTNVMLSLIVLCSVGFFGVHAVLNADTYIVPDGGNNAMISVHNPPVIVFNATSCISCGKHNIILNTPNGTLYTNNTFFFDGSFQFYSCENTTPNPTITVTFTDPVIYNGVAHSAGYSLTYNSQYGFNDPNVHDGEATGEFNFGNISYATAGTKNIHAKFTSTICDNLPGLSCSNPANTREETLEGDFSIEINAQVVTDPTVLKVYVVGEDGKTIGAGSTQSDPAVTSWIRVYDAGTTNNGYENVGNNPALFNPMSPGNKDIEVSNTFNAPDPNNFAPSYAYCSYSAPATTCTMGSYTDIPMLGNGSLCSGDCLLPNISVPEGQTTKVFLKYTPTNNVILKIYRVGPDGTTATAPKFPNGEQGTEALAEIQFSNTGQPEGDYTGPSTDNPYIVRNISTFEDGPNEFHFAYHDARSAPHSNGQSTYDLGAGNVVKMATCQYDSRVTNTCTLSAYETLQKTGESVYDPYTGPHGHCGFDDQTTTLEPHECIYKYRIQPYYVQIVYFKYSDQPDPTQLSATCTSNSPINKGQTATWTAHPSGGTPGYTYLWSGTGSGSANTYSSVYPNPGTFIGPTLRVTSADNQVVTVNCNDVTVNDTVTPPAADVACHPTNPANGNTISQAPVGQPVRWVATAANGTDPAPGNDSDYAWAGSVSGTGKTITKNYTTVGLKTATITYSPGGVTGTPVPCTIPAGNFIVSAQPGYREF